VFNVKVASCTKTLSSFHEPRSFDPHNQPSHTRMLTTDLSSHFTLIFGATGGIGQAKCLALASLGCAIAVHYISASSTAESLAYELEQKEGVRTVAFQADLRDYATVRKLH